MRHYDAIILGRSAGALVAAALLARRDFRVLLLGQGDRGPTYAYEDWPLFRRPFCFLAASSPIWRRVLHELAQSPQFRRRTEALNPMFAVLAEGRRLEFAPNMEAFGAEIQREFPEVHQVVEELYAGFAQLNGTLDAAFERDFVLPPGTLFERLELRRLAASMPNAQSLRDEDFLGKFAQTHPFREIVRTSAAFAANLSVEEGQLPALALARLHGAWTRGLWALERGEAELFDFLTERLLTHGGACELSRRASAIAVRRGNAVGIIKDGDESPTGASAIISDANGEVLAELARGEGLTKFAKQHWPRLVPELGRFVVTLAVRSAGIPVPLPQHSFILPDPKIRREARVPAIHLQKISPVALGFQKKDLDYTLLVAEALLPLRGTLTILEVREKVVETLCRALPFLERHLLIVDSPHDGLPLHDYRSGELREVDRYYLKNTTAAPEPMAPLFAVTPLTHWDLAGEPVRGPVPGTYLVGGSVLPSLGQEGEMLAAWAAARIVTKQDPARQRLRRQMWNKIETT